MHFDTSILTSKAAMDLAALPIALACRDFNVLPQMVNTLDPFGQTCSLKNADFDLGHVELTAILGCIMHFQPLPDALRELGLKGLIEAAV